MLPLVFGKNSTVNKGTDGKVGKTGTFSILGFRVGFSVWKGGLGLGMGV